MSRTHAGRRKHREPATVGEQAEETNPPAREKPRRGHAADPWSGEHVLYGLLIGLLIGAVVGFALGRASKDDVSSGVEAAGARMTLTPDMMQPVAPPTQSGAGGVDAYGRPSGDPHFGHDHP
jgi:hypothetical protein